MAMSNQLASIGAAIGLAFVADVSDAAPLSHGADAMLEATATLNFVEPAHGAHRVCALGHVPRWGGIVRWHRHVGAAHAPVRC